MKYNEKWDLVDEGRTALANGDSLTQWTEYLKNVKNLTGRETEDVNKELIRDYNDKHGERIGKQLLAEGAATNSDGLDPHIFNRIVEQRTQEVQGTLVTLAYNELSDGKEANAILATTGQHPLFTQDVADRAIRKRMGDLVVEEKEEEEGSPLALFIGIGLIALGLVLIPMTDRIFFWPFIVGGISLVKWVAAKVS